MPATTALRSWPAGTDGRQIVLRVTARMRDLPDEALTGLAYCTAAAEALACAMEGDAGGFRLTTAANGAVVLRVSDLGMTFEGSRDFVTLDADRGDDRRFRLDPTRACR